MDTNNIFSPILQPVIKESDENISSHSLLELYEMKKLRLGLSDRAIQKLLGIQLNSLKPILEGTAKQINLVNLFSSAFKDWSRVREVGFCLFTPNGG